MSIDINGIAHLRINVSNFEAAKIFYKKLFDFFKMTIIFESDDVIYAVGGRTGLCVSRVKEGNLKTFNQNNVGLHHFCFRARSSSDVDLCYEFLQSINAKLLKVHLMAHGLKVTILFYSKTQMESDLRLIMFLVREI